jgi:hypothetical protein
MSSRTAMSTIDVQGVLDLLRTGGTLVLTHTKKGVVWVLSDNTVVRPSVARQVITNSHVWPSDDALIAGCQPQTFRWRRRSRSPE